MGENIGAAARAMLNFGLSDLRLVNPRDGWPNQSAITMGSGAFDKIEPQIFDTLEHAISDLHFVLATTARARDMIKPVYTPKAAAENIHTQQRRDQKCGIVFGRERNGLENQEISRCQGIIQIPTNPDFSSLNLGQSVLLLAYELFAQNDDTPSRIMDQGDSFPVSQEKFNEFIDRLDDELDRHGFYKTENLKPTMQLNIRNIFSRNELTDQEVRTLHGVISAFTKHKK